MNHNAGLSGSLLLDALKIQELQGELSRGLLFYVEPFAGTPTYRHQPNRSFTRTGGSQLHEFSLMELLGSVGKHLL